MAEILTQFDVPYSFFSMVLNLQPGRHRYTYELMAAAFRMSTIVVMQYKHFHGIRRPADRSALVQPLLLTPGHGSYPAGHSTQTYFIAHILKEIINTQNSPAIKQKSEILIELYRLAWRIGENRIVAGLHFEDDIKAGQLLGQRLAKHLIYKTTAKDGNGKLLYPALAWLWGKATTEQWT
jgi:membrane-associated phospholipid phosphatase